MKSILSRNRVKTQCTIQFEGAECGAASLCTILKYFGKYVSMERLRQETCVTRDGATAELIKGGAEQNGLNVKVYKANLLIAKEIAQYPSIIYWKNSHFMVLEGFESGYAYLSDPAHGRYRVRESFFKECFSNIIIELSPSNDFKADGKETNNLIFIRDFFKDLQLEAATFAVFSIFSLLPTLFIAGGISYFIDHVLLTGSLNLALGTAWMIVLAAIILLVLQVITTLVLRRLEFKMVMKSGFTLINKLVSVPISFYDTRFSGELSQRAMFCFSISNMICSNIVKFSAETLNSLLVVLFIFISSPILAFVFLIVIIVNSVILRYMLANRMDANVSYSIVQSQARAITLQGIANLQVLKACGSEYDFLERWLNSYTESVNQTQNLAKLVAQSTVISKFSVFFVNICIFTIGGILVIKFHHLTIGSLLAIQFLVAVITAPLADLAMFNSRLQVLDGSLARYADLITNQKVQYNDSTDVGQKQRKALQVLDTEAVQANSSSRCFEAKSISFKYADPLPYILSDINFTLGQKDKIAFVGKSGCGKSTLIKILAGLHEPSSGSIEISGHSWNSEYRHLLRDEVAYVSQHPNLFNASLRDNLTLFNSELYSDEEIHNIASLTGLEELIRRIPNGLDYQIKDGAANISGGQKQLVELTRSLLRQPKWLLLDEATASLDPSSEDRLLENLWKLDLGIISAAHRLKSAVMSNRVYVLDKGSVVEYGTPEELIANKQSKFSILASMEDVI